MSIETFDARRVPFKLVAGNLQGNENAVAICFVPETKAESDRLWRALYAMREAGFFKIEVSKPRVPASEAAE